MPEEFAVNSPGLAASTGIVTGLERTPRNSTANSVVVKRATGAGGARGTGRGDQIRRRSIAEEINVASRVDRQFRRQLIGPTAPIGRVTEHRIDDKRVGVVPIA